MKLNRTSAIGFSRPVPKGPLEFQDKAIRLIHIASKGYPRLINYICDRCLLVLYAQSTHTVDSHVVSKILDRGKYPSLLSEKDSGQCKSSAYIANDFGVVLLLVFIGIIGYYFIFSFRLMVVSPMRKIR